jgi:salicylate hydroxylase
MDSILKSPSCHVLIIGAGLCGLGASISITLAGHRATIFESGPNLHEAGAGIQITPNGVRTLRQWGITERLESKAAIPEFLSMIRYDGRKTLAHRNEYSQELKSRYKEPIWCLHRVDLQKALADRAKELGVRLVFNRRIHNVDFAAPAIVCEDGSREEGDLVIAADGLWSASRSCFLGRPIRPKPTGDLAYRIVLTADQVGDDVEMRNFIARPGIRIWMGPHAHAVAYSLLGGQMMNIVLLVPDDLPPKVAKASGDVNEMAKLFEGWDPLLANALSHVKRVDKWRLMYLHLDEPWRSERGTFALAGDSCHPILPYMAQGANS